MSNALPTAVADVTDPEACPGAIRPGTTGVDLALDRHQAGPAVVTTVHNGVPVGVVVRSLVELSRRPAPLISFTAGATSYSWPALEHARHVGVHLLDARDGLAEVFSRVTGDGFPPGITWRPGPHGVPLLDACAAWLVAGPVQRVHARDQVIVVCDVVAGDVALHAAA